MTTYTFDLGRVRGGVTILGYYATLAALEAAIPNPNPGDMYGVGASAPYNIYAWDDGNNEWVDNGTIEGSPGVSPEVTITAISGGVRVTITDADHPSGQSFDILNGTDGAPGKDGADGAPGADGKDGADGAAATITIGTVSTGEAGGNASVTNSGTSSAAVFNFTIPRGADGTNGTNGTDGADGTDGVDGVSPTLSAGQKVNKVTPIYYTDKDHPTQTLLCEISDGADGQGSGDMTKAVYDDDSAVATAGGIANYVAGEIADIPKASDSAYGLVKTNSGSSGGGIEVRDGYLSTVPASPSQIAARTQYYRPITPGYINTAVKAALSDANRINDMTATEQGNARDVIGAAAKITASGLLKGDGQGGVSAATAGTDYQAPLTAGTDYQTPLVAGTDYQTPLTAGTDYQTPLVAGTDYQTPLTASGILKGDGQGNVSAATAGTDYQTPLVAGTDYVDPSALNNYIPTSDKGANSGVATLDSNGKLTASQASARIIAISSNTTLSSTHYGANLSVTGSRTITIASGLAVGTEIEITNMGTGTVTIAAASGVTMNGTATSRTLSNKYDVAVLKCMASNDWVIKGDAA